MTFKFWKNFKRHGEEKHGEGDKFRCSQCAYRTSRRENLERHMKSRHFSLRIISSLLDSVLCDVVGVVQENIAEEVIMGEVEESGDEVISAHVKARNERVAEIQAEFQRLFPSFDREVQELGLGAKTTKKRKRSQLQKVDPRKSQRVQKRGHTELTPDLEAGNDPEEVVLEARENIEDQETAVVESGDSLAVNLEAADLANGDNSDIGKFVCLPCGIAFR